MPNWAVPQNPYRNGGDCRLCRIRRRPIGRARRTSLSGGRGREPRRGPGGGGTIINVAVTKSGASANEIASEINYEIFRHKRGGVYA